MVSDYRSSRRQANDEARRASSSILKQVKARGFEAAAEYTKKFDGAVITKKNFLVAPAEIAAATSSLSPEEKLAMLEMKRRLEKFSNAQKAALKDVVQKETDSATRLVFRPLKRVGVYVPAGRAPLFSSLFMAAVPAKIAGVEETIVCTPPRRGGEVDRYVLAAAKMCGITKVYKMGGAQAIAAMAYGLDGLLKPVDLICGPGNAYVSAAKQEVSSDASVRIDVPAGPSEVLVIADATADPAFVAADMLAQLEHGSDSAALCLATSKEIADKVAVQLEKQLAALGPENQARLSLPKWGRIWVAASLPQALAAANEIAPEHLELMVKEAAALVPKVRNAGAVFILTGEAFCDYGLSGGNHILPTGASAKAWGGVSLQTFGKWMYVEGMGEKSQRQLAKKAALLARIEGMEAHARAAEARDRDV